MRGFTVSGATIASLADYAASRGEDLRSEFESLGLSLTDLREPESRVPLPVAQRAWEAAAQSSGDVDFGLHFAERLDLDAFHVVGHLARTSRTVGAALDRIVSYSRLLHDAGRTEVERARNGSMRLFPGCRGLVPAPTRHIAEFNAASVVVLTRFITAHRGWRPLSVAFEHAAPRRTVEHRRVFGLLPAFGARETVIVFDAASLQLPVRESNPTRVGQYLEGYARALLAALPDVADDLRGQVLRGLVTSLTEGDLAIGTAAARLGLSGRTLQRRLAALGTTFAELVDDARLRTAERHLADRTLPLAEVSFLLGFKDPSTFHKAFRRWTGKTPGARREELLSPP